MKGYIVCVYKRISNEEKLKEYAVKVEGFIALIFLQEQPLTHSRECVLVS